MTTNGTEIAVRKPQGSALTAKLDYAHELANSGLLPAAFRRNPANVLWAMEYADMLGLPPMVAMTGIHVIEGKPTASAGLISGLVRKARHKLRVTGDDKRAVAEITRCDDPDFTFRSEWTLERAQQAELLGKSNWRKYPAAMLKARAITEAARDACEEALYGLQYTAEELGAEVDEDGVVVAEVVADADVVTVDGAGTETDPWYVRPAPEAEDPWLKSALEAAPGLTLLEACRALWEKSSEKVADGTLAKADAARLQAILRKRVDELGALPAEPEPAPPVAAGLDPDDPWALKVEELASQEEADDALVEASVMLGNGEISKDYFGQIEAAILGRFSQTELVKEEAAA